MRSLFLLMMFATAAVAGCAESRAPASPARLEIVTLDSAVFENTRSLRVWLPPGYDDDLERRYPVVFLNDGQNLFDAEISQTGAEWRVDETAGRLIAEGRIPPVVIVGVDNISRAWRGREYLPWEDVYLDPPIPEPRGRDYPAFLLEEAVPAVAARYRITDDPARRHLGGSSYGALIALYAAIDRPDAFGGLLLESPSFYVAEAAVLDLAETVDAWPARVYLGVGTHEGPSECRDDNAVAEAVADVRRLESILAEAASPPDVEAVVEACGLHDEDHWAGRLPGALEFLLSETEE